MNTHKAEERAKREEERKQLKIYRHKKHEVQDEDIFLDDEMDEDLINFCRKYLK